MSRQRRVPERPAAAAPAGLAWPLVALVLVSIAVCVAATTLFPVSNNDIWIHLKTGQYVLEHGWPPTTDLYSFTAADHPYIAHEWLAAVLFYVSYSVAGAAGMIVFKSLLLAATCALLLLVARRLGADWAAIAPALTVALYIAHPRFLERPHVFSYLLTALYLWLLLGFRATRRARWLWGIPVAQALWANLHGGWVQGIALVAVVALGEGLAFGRARWLGVTPERAPSGRDVALLAGLVPACLVATLLNPYGAQLLRFPFELAKLEFVRVSNYEWQPPYSDVYNGTVMFALYLLYVGALWAALFLAPRAPTGPRAGRGQRPTFNVALVVVLTLSYAVLAFLWVNRGGINWQPAFLEGFLYFLFGLLVLHTVANLRTADFSAAGILALFLLLSLQHNRSVTDATLALFPFVAGFWSTVSPRRTGETPPGAPASPGPARWRDASRPAAVIAGALLMLAVSAFVLVFGYYYDPRTPRHIWGFGVHANMPVCATDFVRRHHITGNAFVGYALAGMLIHRMHPAVKVNIDSRNDVYGDGPYNDYFAALDAPEAMRRFLKRYPVDFFMLSWADRKPAVFDALESTGEWAPVYFDDRVFILVRRKLENEDFIRQHEFRLLKPASGQTSRAPGDAPRVLEEAERAIQDCPAAGVGHTYKCGALLLLARYEESLAACRRAVQASPATTQPYIYMAIASERLGRRSDAAFFWDKILAQDPNNRRAQQELQRLRGP